MNKGHAITNKVTKTMTTREVAKTLGTSSKVILTNAKKCLPNKKIQNGKITYWNEKEVSILLNQIKHSNSNNTNKPLLQSKGCIKLEISNPLRQQEIAEHFQTALTEVAELVSYYKSLSEIKEIENQSLREDLGKEKSYRSIKSVEMQTGKHFKYRELKDFSKTNGYEIHKAFDQNYGEVNTYHVDVWQKVYGLEL